MPRLIRYPFAMECGVYRTSYENDLALLPTPLAVARMWVIFALLYCVPLVAGIHLMTILIQIGIFFIAAVGLNILTGYTGQISIGHAAFMGVGAYASAYASNHWHVPVLLAIFIGGAFAALAGGIFGIPSLRLKGLYLAIATFAAQQISEFVFARWTAVTGGSRGVHLSRPELFGFAFKSEASYYVLVLTFAILFGCYARNLFRTRVGRAFVAVRDRDLAAEVMGIDLFRTKLLAFALSSFYAGVAGALWGHYTRLVTAENFTVGYSIDFLAIVIIGGLGSVMGSLYGTIFWTYFPILLRDLASAIGSAIPNVEKYFLGAKDIAFGVLVIVFLVFESEGLAKLWQNIKDYFRVWPYSY